MSHELRIAVVGDEAPLAFAAEELSQYLVKMSGRSCLIGHRTAYQPGANGLLWLATWSALESAGITPSGGWPALDDPAFDDAIWLDVRAGQGILSGSNARSVLLAVYRLLREAGCRWVRPGPSGEYIPQRNVADLAASVLEKASYRHRGICIEGAVSYENVADMLDWMPKLGYNAYFIQFREAYTFFERWYTHQSNPTKRAEPFDIEQARTYVRGMREEMQKRGTLFHAVGHGWTCEPLGIPGLSWDDRPYEVPAEVLPYLAEVNGQRGLWKGIPLNTNLCYSNPKVRALVTGGIVEYLQQNPDVAVLHFWLADGSNNQCECADCQRMLPADFYVQMLNELDEQLTQAGLDTKVVFLIYVDLLWPPQVERIRNPQRFILMFAPITRSYSQELRALADPPAIPPYQRNKLRFPRNVDENVAFLRAWQAQFSGDSFDFDYHYMWDHYLDPGYYQMAELLSRDVKNLEQIGLNGLISCQVQRAFFPTGLGMAVMGETLWDKTRSFEAIARDYFLSAFGPDGPLGQSYLAELSRRFDPPYLRGEKPTVSAEQAERLAQIPAFVEGFRPIIARNLALDNACWATSWRYLGYHSEMCVLLANMLEARARGDQAGVAEHWQALQTYVQTHEDALQPVLDVFEFIRTLGRRLA